MATTIEILLKSNFDNTGFEAAKTAAKQIADEIGGAGTGDLLSVESGLAGMDELVENVSELAEAYQRATDEAKKFAQAAALASPEEAKKLDQQAKAAQNLANQFKKLGGLTKSEIIKNFTQAGQSISQMTKSLAEASKAQKLLAKAAIEERKAGKAEIYLQRANAIDQQRRALERLNIETNKNAKAAASAGRFDEAFKDVQGIDDFKNRLKGLREQFTETQKHAKGFDKLMDASNALRELDKIEKGVLGADAMFNQLGKTASTLGKIVQSSFFQLGFAMFLLQNTLKNFTGIFKGIKESLIQIGDATNRIKTFSNALGFAGISVSDLDQKLRDASGGYVQFLTQQQQVVRLLNSGLDPVAAQADELVSLARAAELASLGLVKAEQVYPQLVDAIIAGDAATLKSIPGLEHIATNLKIAEINAKEMGVALSLLDRRKLIIEGMGEAFNNLDASELEDAADSTRQMAAALGEIKTSFGIAIASVLQYRGAAKDANDEVGEAVVKATGFVGLLKDIWAQVGLIFIDAREMAAGFIQGAIGLSAILAQSVVPIIAEIQAKFETMALWVGGIGDLFDAIKTGNLEKIPGIIADVTVAVNAEAERQAEITAELSERVAANYGNMVDGVRDALGLVPIAVQDMVHDTNDALSDIQLGSNLDVSGIQAQLDFILGAERKFMMQSTDAWNDYNESVEKINADSSEKILELKSAYFDDLADLREKFSDKSIDLAEKLADKLVDIDEDLGIKTGRMAEDAEDKREDVKKASAKKLEKIEENHQRKINDIMRRFELSRLKALIDRDARALFEAERKRDEDLRKARESEEQKKNDEEKNRTDRLKDIDDDLEKRLQRAREDAERKRADARKDHARAMDDLREQWAEEREARQEKFEEQRDDERAAAKKRRDDARKALKDTITDLKKHFAERNLIAKAQALQDKLNELAQMDQTSQAAQDLHREINDSFHQFVQDQSADIAELVEAYREIESISGIVLPPLSGVPGGGGGGGGSPPPPVGPAPIPPGCDVVVNSALGTGINCTNPPHQIICDRNGNKWRCVDGKIAPHGVAGDVQTSRTSTTTGGGGAAQSAAETLFTGVLGASGGGTTRIPVTIEATGDDTLEAILRNISYNAFIEIVQE